MSAPWQASLGRYAAAVLVTAAVTVLRWALDPWLGETYPLMIVYGAVAFAVWYGGLGPALTAAIIGYLAGDYLFIPPRSAVLASGAALAGIPLYVLGCAVIMGFGEQLRRTSQREQARAEKLAHEIAQQRAAEQVREVAARAAEAQRLEVILDCLPAGVIVAEAPSGRILRGNACARRLVGDSWHDSRSVPEYGAWRACRSDGTPFAPEDVPMARALRGETVMGVEMLVPVGDGRRVTLTVNAAPLVGESGRIEAGVVAFADITAIRSAEARLRESEAHRQQLLELLPVAVYACDADGVITFFNQHAVRLWGRTPRRGDSDERFCGSFRLYRLDGTSLPHDQTPMARAVREGRACRAEEVTIERPDGIRIVVSVNIDPIRDSSGRIVGAINAFSDVSELRDAQVRVRHSEQRLRRALQAADMVAWEIDLATGRLSFSDAPDGRSLLPAERRPGTREEAFALVHPHDRQQVEERHARAIAERASYSLSFRTDPQAGLPAEWLEVHGSVQCDARGEPVMVSGVVFDVTQRRHAEQVLQEANARKDEFLATLAHELRNPLAPMRYAASILKGEAPAQIGQAAREVIERQLAHLARIVDDLLDVSRITRGRVELRREPLDLRAVIEQAAHAAQPAVDAAGHRLELSLPEEPLPLLGDATRLAQVIDNLLSNAVKYTEPGGRIAICAARHENSAEVRVRDTGIGICAEMLERVFDPFVQADPTSPHSHGGLGLGLALCKRLVELHGGRIQAYSAGAGQGSEFVVTVPLCEQPALSEPAASAENVVPLKQRPQRVLVVDDNVDAATSLAALLQISGYETHVGHDGLEALELAERLHPDIVILDIGMPRLNGHEAARRIRAAPWGRDAMLLAVTGWGQDADRKKSREAGFDAHLTKPVDPDELLAMIEAARNPLVREARQGASQPSRSE